MRLRLQSQRKMNGDENDGTDRQGSGWIGAFLTLVLP